MDRYRIQPRFSFRQAFFDPGRHGERLDAVIAAARATLEADPNAFVGDATMLPARDTDVDLQQIARAFGQDFADALDGAPVGEWAGPLRSGFGAHLVLIESREDGREPDLDEVRVEVERDFLGSRIDETRDAFYEALREGYTVRVEREVEEAGGE
jgi:parvulin-like peptidyl-prolyl isomerase